MRLLVDTNALIFATHLEEKLTKKARDIWDSSDSQLFYSPASLWEIAILVSRDRLKFKLSLTEFESVLKSDLGLELLPIRTPHLQGITRLPFHHRDPFDRLIISQAVYEGLSILSSDRIFDKYDEVKRVW